MQVTCSITVDSATVPAISVSKCILHLCAFRSIPHYLVYACGRKWHSMGSVHYILNCIHLSNHIKKRGWKAWLAKLSCIVLSTVERSKTVCIVILKGLWSKWQIHVRPMVSGIAGRVVWEVQPLPRAILLVMHLGEGKEGTLLSDIKPLEGPVSKSFSGCACGIGRADCCDVWTQNASVTAPTLSLVIKLWLNITISDVFLSSKHMLNVNHLCI